MLVFVMKKQEQKPKRTTVLSFRADEVIQKDADRKAKKQKLTRAEYLKSLLVADLYKPTEQAA